MKVPNRENAQIPKDKLADYLLNPEHPDGKSKARFFIQMGFDKNALSDALLKHVRESEVFETKTTPYGIKYVVEGKLKNPSGQQFNLLSVWIILDGDKIPKLITAYPSKK
jgi:hypothetical protein